MTDEEHLETIFDLLDYVVGLHESYQRNVVLVARLLYFRKTFFNQPMAGTSGLANSKAIVIRSEDYRADTWNLENLIDVLYAEFILDHYYRENIALRIERPDICTFDIFFSVHAPKICRQFRSRTTMAGIQTPRQDELTRENAVIYATVHAIDVCHGVRARAALDKSLATLKGSRMGRT